MTQERWIEESVGTVGGADAAVISLAERRPTSGVPQGNDGRGFMSRAREAVKIGLVGGDTSVRVIAQNLAVSGRTLQRRLQENGTTLQKLVASVRCELAMEMLEAPSITLVDIAKTLRFSAPSAFHRAFKRWTGRTPGDYRKEHCRPVAVPVPLHGADSPDGGSPAADSLTGFGSPSGLS